MLDCSGNQSYSIGCGMFDSLNPFQNECSRASQVKWGENKVMAYSTVAESKSIFSDKDYDTNPTSLFQALESKQWSNVLNILKDKSENIEEINTWITRKSKEGGLLWRRSTLHSAIISQAPLDVVKTIIGLSPQLASLPDEQGQLPLHIAFKSCSSDEIIYELLVAYPVATNVKNKDGRIPLQCGISSDPNNYRWKIIGTYSAMMKVQKKKEIALEDGSTAKVKRLKKLHELEMEHLNLEYGKKINECNSKLIECQKEVLGKQEVISQLQEKLIQEAADIASLREEVKDANEAKLKAEATLKSVHEDFVKMKTEKMVLKKAHDDVLLQEKKLQAKVTELHDELFEYRNSLFGGQLKGCFDCGSKAST